MYKTMHGPAIGGQGELVETEVHEDNVAAFLAAGWKHGKLVDSEDVGVFPAVEEEVADEPKPKKKGKK